ncbi:agmatinase, partial [Kocuria sp. CPCC 205273]
AELTGVAAAHVVYELITLLALGPGAAPGGPAYGLAGHVYGDAAPRPAQDPAQQGRDAAGERP